MSFAQLDLRELGCRVLHLSRGDRALAEVRAQHRGAADSASVLDPGVWAEVCLPYEDSPHGALGHRGVLLRGHDVPVGSDRVRHRIPFLWFLEYGTGVHSESSFTGPHPLQCGVRLRRDDTIAERSELLPSGEPWHVGHPPVR